MRVPVSGGDTIELAQAPGSEPTSLAVDGTYVYRVEIRTRALLKIRIDGGQAELVDTPAKAAEVVADAAGVYWLDGAGTVHAVSPPPRAGHVRAVVQPVRPRDERGRRLLDRVAAAGLDLPGAEVTRPAAPSMMFP